MKSKTIGWTVRIVAVLALAVGTVALAEDSAPRELRGEINAYSPQTTKVVNGVTTATGPYEVRGSWSLKLNRDDKAEFSAALNMEFSDGWVLTPTGGNGNFDPSVRGAHTHHITMEDGEVTRLPNGGLQVYGSATVTLNGGATPFAQKSPLTIVITGSGADAVPGIDPIEFSNITLTFAPPASGHFGTAPLPGVVRSVQRER
jgi:hypothetical protein